MEYPASLFVVRDKYRKLDDEHTREFGAACNRFLSRALKEPHAHFCAPGPGSPTRWIIFSVHNFLYPGSYPLPPSYEVAVEDDEYLEALKELASFFDEESM